MISVIVPFRGDGARRDQLWDWVHRRFQALLPDAEILFGDSAPGQSWCKSEAVNLAAARATGDIFLLADADMAIDREWLTESLPQCEQGAICYHTWIHFLNEADSDVILKGPPDADLTVPAVTEFSSPVSWGGACLLLRRAFEQVGGMDGRFRGWGPEDVVLPLTFSGIGHPPIRTGGHQIHLWHPAPPTVNRPWGEGQAALFRRYEAAVDDPLVMWKLIGEKPR